MESTNRLTSDPLSNKPQTNQPAAGQPLTNQPVADLSRPDQPVTGGPLTDQPLAGQPLPNHPVVGGSLTNQAMAGQPLPDQPSAGWPQPDQAVGGGPLAEQPSESRPLSIDSLLEHVQAAPARLGKTRLISIDGPAGSGKSTLADRFAARAEARGLHTRVLHMDDLYEGWSGAVRGFALLRDHVLTRLADGREGRYRRYDWAAGAYAELHLVPATVELLIVEGVTSCDRDADTWQSLKIWIETTNEIRLDRGIERDGEALRDHWLDWMRWERDHFATENTRTRANLIVDGDPTLPHDPALELITKSINLPHDSAAS